MLRGRKAQSPSISLGRRCNLFGNTLTGLRRKGERPRPNGNCAAVCFLSPRACRKNTTSSETARGHLPGQGARQSRPVRLTVEPF